MASRISTRVRSTVGAVVLVASLAFAQPAGATGPLPFFYVNACPSLTLTLATQGPNIRLTTPQPAVCTFVGTESTIPITMLTSFETRVLEPSEIATICSVVNGPTPLTGPNPYAALAMTPPPNGPGTARNPQGPSNLRYSGTHLLVEFHWSLSDGSQLVGVGSLAGSSCGIGASFTGQFNLYDPDLTPTVEFVEDLLGPLFPGDGGSRGPTLRT